VPVIKATIEYDGTDFCGFQKQPSVRTVQNELEWGLGRVFRNPTKIIGAGRTDAGVHATGQVVNFFAPEWFPLGNLRVALNSSLPIDIRIKGVEEVDDRFHARYSAKSRKYVYVVLNREVPSALLARYTWHLTGRLDIPGMRAAAEMLVGTHDFCTFGMPDKPGQSTLRDVMDIRIGRRSDLVILTIKANAFLRGMARAIVGSLVDVGRCRLAPEAILEILGARDRQAVRVIAPPRGLYLTRVEY